MAALRPVAGRVVLHAHDYFLACPNGAFFDYRAGVTCDLSPMSLGCVTCNCDKRSAAQKLWRVARQAVQNRAVSRMLPEATVVLLHEG
ncbi:hypothetical protein [Gemmobacter sp. 24YEA27]|uniref:hypothetical protein n=1 Tax=Gemmobacter sp. 24YEA27 TaxID=3040672 RepID=UPI0024B34F17|nr:hypothetical protein [Gemmobacter sp. 24YEA27]